jgi:fatty acid CoA ligase FadD9
VSALWTSSFISNADKPVFNVNCMPLNHLGGRLPLVSSFLTGGISHFVPESDMSTLFEDWALVRPTELGLVPRVVDMLFQRYVSVIDHRIANGANTADAENAAAEEVRDVVLGGRVLGGFVGTAPLAGEMKAFLDSVLDVHIGDGYGLTEVGGVTKDGVVIRPPVIDYKLVDVPELGYFLTDKPYPRGELLVKTETATPGCHKRPEATAGAGRRRIYRTGDADGRDRTRPARLRRPSQQRAEAGSRRVCRDRQLEAVFAGAPLVRQIFVYGNSERANLLAVVVPTPYALDTYDGDTSGLKSALSDSLQRTAKAAELQSYELPVDFIIRDRTVQRRQRSAVGRLASYCGQTEGPLRRAAGANVRRHRHRTGRRGPCAARAAADQPVRETLTRRRASSSGRV